MAKGMKAMDSAKQVQVSVWLGRLRGGVSALVGGVLLAVCLFATPAMALDSNHAAWSELLAKHVHWNADGTASTVDYAGFARERAALQAYLDQLSAVSQASFDAWPVAERQAFLINAYNAQTVALILTRWPKLESIKDLGGLFSSPWKKSFFTLLETQRSLDDVEHGLLRGAPDFNEPRIHFAVNCASIGCPALRPEAFRGADFDAQLEDQTLRFLRDRTRNRFDPATGVLSLSKIFDWYAGDFERGFRGTRTVLEFAGTYASALSDSPEARARIGRGGVELDYIDYDWALNGPAATR